MLMSLSMYTPRFRTEVDASTVTSPSLNGSRLNVLPRLAVDVNKDLGFKAKDLGFKAKDLSFQAKDLSFKAKAKDLSFKAQILGLDQGQNFVQG